MRIALTLLAAALALPAVAQTPITLDQAMADPDWIATPVEQAWWGWDSHQLYFRHKRNASSLQDTYVVNKGAATLLDDAHLAGMDAERKVYNREHTRFLELRNGDLFERDLRTGALTQITRSSADEAAPQYSADGLSVQFRVGADWFGWNRNERVVYPIALPRAAKDPDAALEDDGLRGLQLRLIATLKRQKDERDAQRARGEQERKADATRAPAPIYLGEKIVIDRSSLSPDGRWLLVVSSPKNADKGRVGKLQKYVTESGYEEAVDQRTRVGHNGPVAESLTLIDLATGNVQELAYDSLPGIATDPLAELRKAQKLPALKGNRALRVEGGEAIQWSGNGAEAAIMLGSVDNKDRWLARLDLAQAKLKSVHHLSDPAWITYNFNQFGWLPDNQSLWYLSEESGYSHLYTMGADGAAHALSAGKWEVSDVVWSGDFARAYFLCNQKWPGAYEVCSVARSGGEVRAVTALNGGVEDFELAPNGSALLVRHSSSYAPSSLSVVPVNGGAAVAVPGTDTRTAAYKARSWVEPQMVQVPSTHGAAPIWAKLYRPAQLEAGKRYPIVMFVHGAGYLQNVTAGYPVYFREQMFHNLLVQQGYIVLDMDYRGSKGYGRDWRTAIYRQMGHPELDDYIDGVNWLVEQHQGDAKNVGVYGGSYGGFMTLMALMRAPEVFKSGAALRPVSDWTSYNHGYTSNILNTPDIDPEAYKTSSPIEYAENLRGNLLIAHGMIDDNVFYQDSVRMEQRLIELKKDNWEMASYPLERHGFVQPESWFDEYRRIDKLFERTLK